eukprot:gene13145-biopygen17003
MHRNAEYRHEESWQDCLSRSNDTICDPGVKCDKGYVVNENYMAHRNFTLNCDRDTFKFAVPWDDMGAPCHPESCADAIPVPSDHALDPGVDYAVCTDPKVNLTTSQRCRPTCKQDGYRPEPAHGFDALCWNDKLGERGAKGLQGETAEDASGTRPGRVRGRFSQFLLVNTSDRRKCVPNECSA